MKIGRNDPCPCGSGKKYKNCCLRKDTMSVPEQIRYAVKENGYKEDVEDVLVNMYRYMERKQWWGALPRFVRCVICLPIRDRIHTCSMYMYMRGAWARIVL